MRNLGRLAAMVAVAAASVALAGCSNSAHSAAQQNPGLVASKATAASTAHQKRRCSVEDIAVTGAFSAKPKVTIPRTCAPPKRVVFKDVIPGTGPEIKPDSTITVNYTVINFATGKVVDSSYRRGVPVTIPGIGDASVLRKWNEDVIGAKGGGRRMIVLPPNSGGPPPQAPHVTPDTTLVMVVDILDVKG